MNFFRILGIWSTKFTENSSRYAVRRPIRSAWFSSTHLSTIKSSRFMLLFCDSFHWMSTRTYSLASGSFSVGDPGQSWSLTRRSRSGWKYLHFPARSYHLCAMPWLLYRRSIRSPSTNSSWLSSSKVMEVSIFMASCSDVRLPLRQSQNRICASFSGKSTTVPLMYWPYNDCRL